MNDNLNECADYAAWMAAQSRDAQHPNWLRIDYQERADRLYSFVRARKAWLHLDWEASKWTTR